MANQRLPLNTNREIVLWGPTPGRYYYSSGCFKAIFFDFPREHPGYGWPKTLYLLKGNKIFWLNENPNLRNAGIKVFKKYMMPRKSRINLKRTWEIIARELDVFEEKIDSRALSGLTDEELYRLGKIFFDLIARFWKITVPQELGNYGSDYLLEKKVENYIPEETERIKVMEILTAPEELSFYQQEELALMKARNLEKHQEEHFWLQNSYNGARVLPISFFEKRKKQLPKNLDKIFAKHIKEVEKKKKFIKNKYRLPKAIMNIAEALSFGIAWQDERKGNIFKYIHYLDLFLKEVARRKKYDFSSLLNANIPEVISSIKKDIRPILKKRRKNFGFIFSKGEVRELNNFLTSKYWRLYGEEKGDVGVKQFEGIVASEGKGGKLIGKVKIVTDPFRAKDFKTGDILVSPFTAPEYVFLMKKASAIITNAGGLTSHAAIISRELKIPCIVGTRIATKVLKTGDFVEIDVPKGKVKIV